MDCSSPMSANIDRNTGSRDPSATGIRSPACAINDSSPAVLSATVLPPVFGPVMSSTFAGGRSRMVTGTGPATFRSPASGPILESDARQHLRHQQRMSRREELEGAVGRQLRLDAVDQLREPGARLQHVEVRRRLDGPLHVHRT